MMKFQDCRTTYLKKQKTKQKPAQHIRCPGFCSCHQGHPESQALVARCPFTGPTGLQVLLRMRSRQLGWRAAVMMDTRKGRNPHDTLTPKAASGIQGDPN